MTDEKAWRLGAILHHEHPPELTAKRVSLKVTLPNAWAKQKALLLTA